MPGPSETSEVVNPSCDSLVVSLMNIVCSNSEPFKKRALSLSLSLFDFFVCMR